MNRIFIHLGLMCFAFLARGADVDSREPFALYAVVPKDTAGAKAFSFQVALIADKRSGFYAGTPILALSHLAEVTSGYPEAGTIPFPALFFRFTTEGYKRLRDYTKSAEPSELVMVLDGRAYTTITPQLIREVVERRIKLRVLIPSALHDTAELERLAGKLKPAHQIKKQ